MFKSFLSDKSGNFAIIMGMLLLPLLLSVGLSVDYSRYLSAESHLQELADVASLALAGSREEDEEKLEVIANDFVAANIGTSKFDAVEIVDLKTENDQIDLDLKSTINTYFMGLANIDTLDVHASALAERAVTGSVEVALVLDNTDSMNQDNKIGTLKIAAADLVKKLHESDGAAVRIALVPYAEQVNVGLANRNASWLSVGADYSTSKTTSTEGKLHQPMKNGTCKTPKAAGSRQVEKDGVWVTETWPAGCAEWNRVPNGPEVWLEPTTTTTITYYEWHGCIGSRVDNKKLVLSDLQPSVKYPGFLTSGGANKRKCLTEIIPLTDSKDVIDTAIKGMITSRSGYTPQTYIPGGLMWGINVLSPSEPFAEGAAYHMLNTEPRKVIVLMTDGLNTMRAITSGGSTGQYTSANAGQRKDTNKDTTELCNYAKEQKIEIFTVAFKVDDGDAKTMLLGCATDAEHYYDASDPEALLAAFTGIAQSLSQVRLAR
jgi:Flp pilus assembly protein TadG